ncbi:hypothetical protein FKW77_008914 [Venturia effusa]|uniref:Leucine-rich repeat domain-containing protein n=1 Tax=Venturia effusa TaxID=50376 RepID=A0A517LCU1_9PEZI|nr:hypothetical protein FKW77_008914 [Venturia effusa]
MSVQPLAIVNTSDPSPKHINLLHLSNELLITIIRHISFEVELTQGQRPYGHRPLFVFSLTSKRLYQLTEPILYHRFVEEFLGNPNALQLFLKRIILRPDLAQLVRIYHGSAKDSHYHDNHLSIECLKEGSIWSTITERVAEKSNDADEAEEWIKSIEEGNWEAITALTLSLLPKIQDLKFQGWSYKPEKVYPNLLRYLSRARDLQLEGDVDNVFALGHLKKVTVEYWDTEGGMRLSLLLPFLSIPSVDTLWAARMSDGGTWDSTIQFPNIKALSFKPANVDSDLFQKFLRSFPNLVDLYYQSGFGETSLEPPRFRTALAHLKSSLTTLTLFDDEADIGEGDLAGFPIGSLVEFERLHTLRLESSMLTGEAGEETVLDGFSSVQSIASSLPSSLCHLQLLHCEYNSRIASEIVHLIAWKSSVVPHLKTLDIGWERIVYPDKPSPPGPFKYSPFERAAALQLLEDMEAVGVEMIMPAKPPEAKFVCYMKEHERAVEGISGFFGKIRVSHPVYYPYDEYEKLCEEHGCDPATGRAPGLFY